MTKKRKESILQRELCEWCNAIWGVTKELGEACRDCAIVLGTWQTPSRTNRN